MSTVVITKSQTVRSKDGKLVFVIQESKSTITNREWMTLSVQKGKRKPKLYSVRNRAEAERFISATLKAHEFKAQARAEAAIKRAEKAAGVHVGDIFVSSWGYEQTNVDFYKVLKLVGKLSMIVQKVTNQMVEGSTESHGMACKMVPGIGTVGEPFKARIGAYGSFKVRGSSYQSAHKWEGKPQYCSWYY